MYHCRLFRKDKPLTPAEAATVDDLLPLAELVDDIVETLPDQMDLMINDAPKRAQVRGQKQHNGYHSCDYCLAKGLAVKNPNSKRTTVCYPFDQTFGKPLRTNEAARDLRHKPPGIVAQSPLLKLDPEKFDIVQDIPVEMMHTVTGVVKRLFELCYSTTRTRTTDSTSKLPLSKLEGISRHVQVIILLFPTYLSLSVMN